MPYKAAQNEFSCALACIVSALNDFGDTKTQEEISKQYFRFFPEWKQQEGVLSKTGILRLLEEIKIKLTSFYLTNDLKDFLDLFSKNDKAGKKVSLCLILLHGNSHHCLRILQKGMDGNGAFVFDPDRLGPKEEFRTWESMKNRSPEYLLIYSSC